MLSALEYQPDMELRNAVDRLSDTGKSLSFAVEFFLANYHQSDRRSMVCAVCADYLKARSREVERGIISRRHFLGLRVELRRLERAFGTKNVRDVSTVDLEDYLNAGPSSLKTWNNRRGYLSSFFRFCAGRNYLKEDPVRLLPHYRIQKRRGTAETLSAEQCEELMAFLEEYSGRGKMKRRYRGIVVNYFALTLFAGIRPDWNDGEIGKIRSQHINLATGVVHIEPEVSKVNEKRNVRIQPNLALWLERYPLGCFSIIPPGFRRMRLDIRKRFVLGHDVLRHTYISMLVGKFRSVGDAALQSGNSEAVVRRYYLDVKSQAEAERFWRIVPRGKSFPG